MAAPCTIFGSELSPYSVKVRAWFRYKGVPHHWRLRRGEALAEYQARAKLPIIPLVLTPEGAALQDSTPIIEALEQTHPTPSIHPDDPVCAFVSMLLEEFGDEWANKWMFHLRWAREVDQVASAGRIARSMLPDASETECVARRDAVRARMVERVGFVGSNADTAPMIEASFERGIALLDAHLARVPYLFGARPSFGDFGLWGQLYAAWTDPTAGSLIEGRTPHLLDWIQRMLWPRSDGPTLGWTELAPTLAPLLAEQVGGLFLPWSVANAQAIAAQAPRMTVALPCGSWSQAPQKYHARSLAALREKLLRAPERERVEAVLREVGCWSGLGE